jgi:hypothetical protein
MILRELLGGRIDLKPEGDGELWAEYTLQPGALLQVVGNRGSGGRYELYSNYPLCIQAVVASTATRDCAIPVR